MIINGERSSAQENRFKFWAKVCGFLAPALIPPAHIGVLLYFWSRYTRTVDTLRCQNSCFDTVFKGPYETGVASYKHMYFNATSNTLKIWVITVAGIIAFYECIKYLMMLLLRGRIRVSMLVLFVSSIFAHYYSWWMYVNYWNDEYYPQWNHQLFFCVTELASTAVVLQLCDARRTVTHRKALAVSGIAALHIFAGGFDQFVANVLFGEGRAHQVVRDLGFMLPDVLHLLLPLVELRRAKRFDFLDKDLRREVFYVGVTVMGGFIFVSFL